MDEQLKEYLAVMQVQEEEYKSGGIKYQSRIIRAFEKSRKRSTYVDAKGDHEPMDTSPAAKRLKRVVEHHLAACVASVNFKVSKCHHTDSNARLTRSATFAGMAKVVNSEIIHSVWITARHGGMVDGTEVLIRLGKDAVVGTCIYDDANSDVSIIAGSPMNGFADAGQLSYSHEITQGKLVGILGFPMNSDPNLGRAALITGYIASTVTGGRTGLPAEATEWRSQRFFLVDKNCDFGMSGGPIIDAQGGVVGMLCASCTANIQSSWAVLSSYMCDALDAVVVAWV